MTYVKINSLFGNLSVTREWNTGTQHERTDGGTDEEIKMIPRILGSRKTDEGYRTETRKQ